MRRWRSTSPATCPGVRSVRRSGCRASVPRPLAPGHQAGWSWRAPQSRFGRRGAEQRRSLEPQGAWRRPSCPAAGAGTYRWRRGRARPAQRARASMPPRPAQASHTGAFPARRVQRFPDELASRALYRQPALPQVVPHILPAGCRARSGLPKFSHSFSFLAQEVAQSLPLRPGGVHPDARGLHDGDGPRKTFRPFSGP